MSLLLPWPALLPAGTPLLHSTIFSKPATLGQVTRALLDAFQLDPSSAALLLRAQAGFSGGEVTAAPLEASTGSTPGSATNSTADSSTAAGGPVAAAATAGSTGSSIAKTAEFAAVAGAGHPLLPRMPLSLQYLISVDSYKAAAGVARALGRAARLADLQQTGRAGGCWATARTGMCLAEDCVRIPLGCLALRHPV